ncbi:hypothetical protein [Nocardiopsis sp. JB363]|uniref:hypothetical protein n=1 Tax=Nocardiopsis sp. JB363 TaxID=1434837 RepID=UPI00117E7379|nr:hypothetical protein [Nocardiopsis sp. JB363]
MAEGLWRCGMCAAHNEPSKHTCMVCDTVREVGTRGESGEGDLLAPVESTAFSPEEAPPIRVMETPRRTDPSGVFAPTGVRPGGDGPAGDGSEAAGTEPEPAAESHRRRSKGGLPRWPQGTVRALTLAVVGAGVLLSVWVLPRVAGEDAAGTPRTPAVEEFCPDRVSELMPGEGPGSLEAAYETERHRIVLCSNSVGELFYFGEFLHGDGEAMVVPAEHTDEGYVAESGQTRYEVVGDEVVITGSDGQEMARLALETVENPR